MKRILKNKQVTCTSMQSIRHVIQKHRLFTLIFFLGSVSIPYREEYRNNIVKESIADNEEDNGSENHFYSNFIRREYT